MRSTCRYCIRGLLVVVPVLLRLLVPAAPVQAQTPDIRELTLGLSAQGRPITAVQIGSGERKLVIVGDTHGGPEANTYYLTLQLIDYFKANPQRVPPAVRLYLIPTINPDGLALGSRFDAFQVDLNRNMNTNLDECAQNDWRYTVYGAYGLLAETGGAFPESQLESRITRNFLLDAAGAIFPHSNAGLVFPAFCEHAPSIDMAKIYAEAANYTYLRYWPNYMITGGMHDWAGSLGIAAIIPELVTATDSEFEQNLAGVLAVLQAWDKVLPLPQDQTLNGFRVPAVIWRYWKAHGGEAVFGLPLEPSRPLPGGAGVQQTFSRARLEMRPALADTPFLVQPVPLRVEHSAQPGGLPGAARFAAEPMLPTQQAPPGYLSGFALYEPVLFFESTGHRLSEAFLVFWRRNGGQDVFGAPTSVEFTMLTADGQRRIVQYFERAIFAYYPEDGSVRLEPLGWQALLRERVQASWVVPQVR